MPNSINHTNTTQSNSASIGSRNSTLANAIRFLSIDAVNKAKSGHPGAPMGMADMAVALWKDHLAFNPTNPDWINRDRFVLSNGHASMLLYSVLHLTGYDLTIDDIKDFRKLHSKTPGHPENYETIGVETTTGPLGQGVATAIGMALAEKMLAAQFNKENFDIINHYTYVFLGDGCLMEGISHEACSLAGTYKLNKLIVLYDDNGISIDGKVKSWFTDDTKKRFESYQWNVIADVNGQDALEVSAAIAKAKLSEQPTLICCKTTIGYGSPNKSNSEKAHGSPLGDEERQKTAQKLGWNYKPFEIPQDIYDEWDAKQAGIELEANWQTKFELYKSKFPELAFELERRIDKQFPDNFSEHLQSFITLQQTSADNVATRVASQKVLNFLGGYLPEMVGGSADLTGSNNTNHENSVAFNPENGSGNYFSYGVREFAMSAIMNGMANYGGFIPYAGTFLVFSDYARNAMRLSAIMQQRVIYVMTHDSIGLGEDGPTHQPIEHLASLRIIPNMQVWRPCDSVETAVAWQSSITHLNGPTTLALSRQNLEKQNRDATQIANIIKGGYTLQTGSDITLIATGSEVGLAADVVKLLATKNISVQLVSMPCYEIYRRTDLAYQQSVIPTNQPRVVIEAGSSLIWEGLVAGNGFVVGIDCFGASAPADKLYPYFGLDAEIIAAQITTFLKK